MGQYLCAQVRPKGSAANAEDEAEQPQLKFKVEYGDFKFSKKLPGEEYRLNRIVPVGTKNNPDPSTSKDISDRFGV